MTQYKVSWSETHEILVDASTNLEAIKEAIGERTNNYSKSKTCINTSALTAVITDAAVTPTPETA